MSTINESSESIERMKQRQAKEYHNCPELSHIEADKILCGFLKHLGYTNLVDEFNKRNKLWMNFKIFN